MNELIFILLAILLTFASHFIFGKIKYKPKLVNILVIRYSIAFMSGVWIGFLLGISDIYYSINATFLNLFVVLIIMLYKHKKIYG